VTSIDTYWNIDTIARFVTFGAFVIFGFDVAHNSPRPKSVVGWIAVFLVVVLAGFVGVNVSLISIFGIGIHLNMVLLGTSFGFLAGLILKEGFSMRPRKH
jgi:hypothetical protein